SFFKADAEIAGYDFDEILGFRRGEGRKPRLEEVELGRWTARGCDCGEKAGDIRQRCTCALSFAGQQSFGRVARIGKSMISGAVIRFSHAGHVQYGSFNDRPAHRE